jgi:hypothetical protein
MTTAASVNKIVWMKTRWGLDKNPFPAEAIARLGGKDARENGLLFDPEVQPHKMKEVVDKFVLGSLYSGLKFGYLWSLGTGVSSDARGFGKSSTMQYLVEHVNRDWGRAFIRSSGLGESDADENPLCAVLASFDMANARSLNAVFYEAARYACRFRTHDADSTLAEKVLERLIAKVGSDDPAKLRSEVDRVQQNLRGRTLGPLVDDFLEVLLGGDAEKLAIAVDDVTAGRRTRSGAAYLATLLVFISAAGVDHVLLCCDQLEDFAASTTTRQKRTLEVERFRDYILEIQPMSDMLSVVVTMHPRATQAIGEMWALADLPSYDHSRSENEQRVVVLEAIATADKAMTLLLPYLGEFRKDGFKPTTPLFPFTEDTVATLLQHSDGKPRDILRKASALIEQGAERNWDEITPTRAAKVLESFRSDDEYSLDFRVLASDDEVLG